MVSGVLIPGCICAHRQETSWEHRRMRSTASSSLSWRWNIMSSSHTAAGRQGGWGHLSGHQDIRNSFCFLDESVVPWHWCSYSKSYRPYLKRLIMWMFVTNMTGWWSHLLILDSVLRCTGPSHWPALRVSAPLQIVEEVVIARLPASHGLHRDGLLLLDVEHHVSACVAWLELRRQSTGKELSILMSLRF